MFEPTEDTLGMATRLHDLQYDSRHSTANSCTDICLLRRVQTAFGARPGYGQLLYSQGVNLTGRIRLGPRLRMRGATPAIPHTPI